MKPKRRFHYGVTCPSCGDRIFSASVHDFVDCKCGQTFVDGGLDYFRVGGKDPEKIKRWRMTLEQQPSGYWRVVPPKGTLPATLADMPPKPGGGKS